MIGIDLFAGSGGLSEGARLAGIEVKLAIESDPHVATTYLRNHPDTFLWIDDIRNINDIDIDVSGDTTIIFGGPPCQGFSTSNQRTRGIENEGNWLFLEFLRIVGMINPDWVLFENVTGITETEEGLFLKAIVSQLECLGYECSTWELNAADYGVPQKRNRLFVVGSADGIILKPPKPTVTRYITVGEAIADLPYLENGASINWMPYGTTPPSDYAKSLRNGKNKSPNHLVTKNRDSIIKRYMHIPPGGNWQDIPIELVDNYTDITKCHTKIYHRLTISEPSVVIGNYRKNMLVHPTENRGLSVREAARLQSFHDQYEFCGTIGFQQQQVGNAVPPLLAKAVFTKITNSLRNRP
jgi:DNA (cytosine-5)-methyltransferase 1